MRNEYSLAEVLAFLVMCLVILALCLEADARGNRIIALESQVCPPCPCQLEPEAEFDLPTPRFPRGHVR